MNEKQMSEKFASLKKAMEELNGILGNEDEDDEMTSEEICTELTALAAELEQIGNKAEALTEKALAIDLDTDGAARLFYALAFMVKMNADAQRAQLQLAVDYIRKKNAEDER